MDVTIHRGSKEIGGSCVEVSSGATRLILDVGLPLVTPEREPFDAGVIRHTPVEELLRTRVIPPVPGLYTEGDPPTAILLSHCHLDHVGLLHLTRPEIPIYATKGTSKMMLAGKMFGGREGLDRDRHMEIDSGKPVTIGGITVTPFAVDHSCYGSVALLLEADGRTVLYSGDLRRHGRKPGMIRDMVAEVGPRKPDVLIMEGTHLGSGRGKGKNEYQLEDEIHGIIAAISNLVLGSFSPIDVDRVITYYKASKRAGRIFVADAYTAFVMHLVSGEIGVPSGRDTGQGVQVFYNAAFRRREEWKRRRTEELFSKNTIGLDEILANPSRYVMMFRPSMAEMDFGGRLPAGSRCIYSYWKGYLDNPDWVKCQAQLREAGGELIPAHASGHIYEEDLEELVQQLAPRTLIPIHTFEPSGFHRFYDKVTLLADGERFSIG
jgi:ribonuclease J